MTRTMTACMVCGAQEVQRSETFCPCCNERLHYVYCEDCNSMFLEHRNSNQTTMISEPEE